MHWAWAQAQRSAAVGEVPIGAVLVGADGEGLEMGHNQPIATHDPSAHAEIVCLRAACAKQSNYRLPGSCLYVTVEPCTMCFGALIHARVARLVFGAHEPRAGALGGALCLHEKACYNHRIEVRAGVLEKPCSQLMRDFFRARRS